MPERESDRETDAVTERHKVIIKKSERKEEPQALGWSGGKRKK